MDGSCSFKEVAIITVDRAINVRYLRFVQLLNNFFLNIKYKIYISVINCNYKKK